MRVTLAFAALILGLVPTPAAATVQSLDTLAFAGLDWRMVGPYRGGRSSAVTGFVVAKGWLFFKKRKRIPMIWVEESAEYRVRLAVSEATIDRVPDYRE